MQRTIWTNDLDYVDWQDELEEEYPDSEGYNEDDRINTMYEINNSYLEDEEINLNKELSNNIVVIADAGLWNGRRSGYKFIGTNLNCVLSPSNTCGDLITWYVEDKEVKCKDVHHDGTNYYTYRVLKQNIDKNEFEEAVFDTSIEEATEKYTEPLGHYVAEIYGFELEEKS